MKIKKINIKKFKIFDSVEFNFTDENDKALDKIVLAGINGTGKTTFLELIVSAFVENIKNNNYNNAEYFGLNLELLPEEQKSFENFLNNTNHNDLLQYGILKSNTLELSVAVAEKYFTENEDNETVEEFNVIQPNTLSYLKEFILSNDFGFKIAYLHDFTTSIEIKNKNILKLLDFNKLEENLEIYFQKVITKQLFKNRNLTAAKVIQLQIDKINNILENIETMSKIEDIDNNKLIFKNFKGDKLFLKDLSAGEKQLFYRAIYLSALNLNNCIILVDEPELSLHPTWQKNILKLYDNIGKNNQIIVATHSPHILGNTNPENLFVLHVNEKDKKLEVINLKKAGKYSKGVEPNRILKEIMETPLRDFEIQKEIDYISENLDELYNDIIFLDKAQILAEKLGSHDPFIIRLQHQLLLKQKD